MNETMSQKRKLEEYHDPDYPQVPELRASPTDSLSPPPKKVCPVPSTARLIGISAEDRRNKILSIVEREFDAEIRAKELEIDEIEKRIDRGRQLLAKVRYAVVHSYYTKKNLLYSEEEMHIISSQLKSDSGLSTSNLSGDASSHTEKNTKIQPAIHPSLKKILGKRPLDYNEILKVRPVRRAARTATEKFQVIKKQPAGSIKLQMQNVTIPAEPIEEPPLEDSEPAELKFPKYVSPQKPNRDIQQVNSARGRNHTKHVLVVGNTSKYIGHEEMDSITNVTHKWLLYLTMKTVTPIEQIVAKVRFFLHESYKPNDIVEISSPPFHLSRRGWGEFPVRLMLYFHPHIQEKPMQLFHNLQLDKKHTGLQTMGGETVVELWLNQSLTNSSAPPIRTLKLEKESEDEDETETLPISTCSNQFQLDAELPTNLLASPGGKPDTKEPLAVCAKKHVIGLQANTNAVQSPTSSVRKLDAGLQITNETLDKTTYALNPASTISTPRIDPVKPDSLPVAAATSTALPKAELKKFVKCIDKNGKVSLIQVVVDPNNPKILRMVTPAAISTITKVASTTTVTTPSSAPKIIKLSSVLPLAGNRSPIVLPKLSVISAGTTLTQIAKPLLGQIKKLIQAPTRSPEKLSASAPVRFSIESPSASKPLQSSAVNINQIVAQNPARKLIRPSQPQQSLLKPQFSLLKSSNSKKPQLTIADKSNMKVITVKNIVGLQNKQINVFFKQEVMADPPAGRKMDIKTQPNRRWADKLERSFSDNKFSTVRGAAAWLLQRLPLISPLRRKVSYHQSFPFAVESDEKYQGLSVAKHRSHEWLRAKYVVRQLQQHPSLRSPIKVWTTKQVVQFGRIFGYTPPHASSSRCRLLKQGDLKQIIESEINREHLMNDTISFNHMLNAWIAKTEDTLKTEDTKANIRASIDEEAIVVDDDDSTVNSEAKKANLNASNAPPKQQNRLRLPENRRIECSLVDEICRSAGIGLQPEEIVDGVLHETSQLILATAMRSFLEELMRRAHASGLRQPNEDWNKVVSSEDVQRAIISTEHFDFLTNKNLGVTGVKSKPS